MRYKILEGNKQLSKSLAAFLKRRDKITNTEWKKTIRPLMKQAQNDIITTLKSNNLTDWGIWNLKRIQDSISMFITRFDSEFKSSLRAGQMAMTDFTVDAVDSNLKWAGLNKPSTLLQSENVLSSIFPMTDGFVEFFTRDLAKIVNAEISLGLINQQSVNQVAKNITDKFISSQMSFDRAERIARTELMRASSIAEHMRGLEIAELNPDMRKIWISSHKANYRPSHLAAENRYSSNPIPINQKFVVGGETGMFPRDYSFSAKNTVNCGCTVVYISIKQLEGIKSLSENI